MPTAVSEMLARFAACVEPLGALVARVADGDAAAAFLADVAAESEASPFILAGELRDAAPALVAALDRAGIAWRSPTTPDDARDQPLGVGLAVLAVAETGSVMLAERTLADRAVGLLVTTNVTLVRTGELVPALTEAAAALKEVALRPGGGYGTLVTGPSRTADIEMSLTVGVQGPARSIVLFVDELT